MAQPAWNARIEILLAADGATRGPPDRTLSRAALALLLGAGASRAIPASDADSDPGAEFARSADLLEAGRRSEAEQLLGALGRRMAQPAWNARIEILLAADDAKRGR